MLAEALRRDPDYAFAHALSSGAHAQIFRSAVEQERAHSQKAAEEHARRALALDSDDSRVLTYAGWAVFIVANDVTRGRAALEKATLLNPNLAVALAYHGLALALTGEPEAAIERDANKLFSSIPLILTTYQAGKRLPSRKSI